MRSLLGLLCLTLGLLGMDSVLAENTQSKEQPAYAADRLIVAFDKETGPVAVEAINRNVRAKVVRDFRSDASLKVVQLASGSKPDEMAAYYRNQPGVRYAHPDYYLKLLEAPDDPLFGDQWALENTGQLQGLPGFDIDAVKAWSQSGPAGRIEYVPPVVAFIDSGIDTTHEDIWRFWRNRRELPGGDGIDNDGNGYIDDTDGWDFVRNDNDPEDERSHGTHTAGTAAAERANGLGIAGVGRARLMILKTFNYGGFGLISDNVEAIDYAIDKGARIINASWGCSQCTPEDVTALQDALDRAEQAGVLFVAAAGNVSGDSDVEPITPAAFANDNIISVAAMDRFGNKSGFSNFGASSVDLGAPGSSIVSTIPTNDYDLKSGTSMAAPHVTGAIAHLMGINGILPPLEYKQLILDSVEANSDLAGVTVTGGVLNLHRAVNLLSCGAVACCGNSVQDDGEACDADDFGGDTCETLGYFTGSLACSGDCQTVDTSACNNCGNDQVDAGENCDGSDLGGATCQSQGFDAGMIACNGGCSFDTSGCWDFTCGNSICEPAAGEDCASCPQDCNGKQNGPPSGRYCCGDGDGSGPVGCEDPRCSAGGNTCYE